MNSKTKALTLLSVVVIAAVAGSLFFVSQLTVKADPTTSVATDAVTTPSVINASNIGCNGFFNGPIAFATASRSDIGFRRMNRGFGEFGTSAIQVSSDYTANVTNIVNNDSDVQNLLNQGYNITSIRPVISTIVDGNGNIVTTASTANVLLQGNNRSRALVVVDLNQAKVTKIVTMAVTEIDK